MIEPDRTHRAALKVGRVLLVSSLLAIGLAPTVRAQTVYTYTGNAFTNCNPSSYCSDVAGSVSFSYSLLPGTPLNLIFDNPGNNIASHVTNFKVKENSGLVPIPGFDLNMYLVTDHTGQIIDWYITPSYFAPCTPCIETTNKNTIIGIGLNYDASLTVPFGGPGGGVGTVFDSPGTWSTTPEPPTFLLFGTGLLALGFALKKAVV